MKLIVYDVYFVLSFLLFNNDFLKIWAWVSLYRLTAPQIHGNPPAAVCGELDYKHEPTTPALTSIQLWWYSDVAY